MMNDRERIIVNEFHNLYYDGLSGGSQIFGHTFWMNIPCLKCPLDLWTYQEIINEVKPDLVIETGTYLGGSALFIAHLLDILGNGKVVSIDKIVYSDRPTHQRIEYVTGSSTDEILVSSVLNSYCL